MSAQPLPYNTLEHYAALEDEATYNSSGLRVGIMPLDVETSPDITIVCGEPHVNPFDKNSITSPSVILEVLSPSTERFDQDEK